VSRDEHTWKEVNIYSGNGRTDDYREKRLTHLNRMGNTRSSKYVLQKKPKDMWRQATRRTF
jgi:hypothetical protein